MQRLPFLAICFAFGVLCNIAACETPHKFGEFVCMAAGILCFFCFFDSLLNRGD